MQIRNPNLHKKSIENFEKKIKIQSYLRMSKIIQMKNKQSLAPVLRKAWAMESFFTFDAHGSTSFLQKN